MVTLSSSPLPVVIDLEDEQEVEVCTPESGENNEVEAKNQQKEQLEGQDLAANPFASLFPTLGMAVSHKKSMAVKENVADSFTKKIS